MEVMRRKKADCGCCAVSVGASLYTQHHVISVLRAEHVLRQNQPILSFLSATTLLYLPLVVAFDMRAAQYPTFHRTLDCDNEITNRNSFFWFKADHLAHEPTSAAASLPIPTSPVSTKPQP